MPRGLGRGLSIRHQIIQTVFRPSTKITPFPGGKRDLFYIFTNSNGSVWYSIADLSAQPNGRVTVKNQGPLATNTGETQGMVPHANGRAIWLLVYNTGATVDA